MTVERGQGARGREQTRPRSRAKGEPKRQDRAGQLMSYSSKLLSESKDLTSTITRSHIDYGPEARSIGGHGTHGRLRLASTVLGHTLALTIFVLICSIQMEADCRRSQAVTSEHHSDYRWPSSETTELSHEHDEEDDYEDSSGNSRSDLQVSTAEPVGAAKVYRNRPKPVAAAQPTTQAPVATTSKPTSKLQALTNQQKAKAVSAAREASRALNRPGTSSKPHAQVDAAIHELGRRGREMEKRRNKTIVINGRKFDQLNPIECVDDEFYQTLVRDLSLIDLARTRDEYETYYDDERAKAIGAIVDTPESLESKRSDGELAKQLEAASGHSRSGLANEPNAPATGQDDTEPLKELSSMAAVNMTSQRLLVEIKMFWYETAAKYKKTQTELNLRFSRRKRTTATSTTTTTVAPKASSTSIKPAAVATPDQKEHAAQLAAAKTARPIARKSGVDLHAQIPNYKRALENHNYLMRRLEDMKTMLLNGEEAIIVINNRVKKLQQAVGEEELQRALCSCITSRGGRAALMLISELFTDRGALKKLRDLDGARERARTAALDTAEFCSYWYGDTLRAQAIQKEKQIRRMIMKIKAQIIYQRERHTYNTTSFSVKRVKVGNRIKKIVTITTRMHVIEKVVEMTRLWMPPLSGWITDQIHSLGDLKGLLSSHGLQVTHRSTERPVLTQTSSYTTSTTKPPAAPDRPKRELIMATPFDEPGLYDVADEEPIEDDLVGTTIVQSFISKHYNINNNAPVTSMPLLRGRRGAASSTTRRAAVTSSTLPPAKSAKAHSEKFNHQCRAMEDAHDFEDRSSVSACKCALAGFSTLIDIAYETNAIMYETTHIKSDSAYMQALREAWASSFGPSWVEKRDEWAKKFQEGPKKTEGESLPVLPANQDGQYRSSLYEQQNQRKSVDEIIDDALEQIGNAYERGVRLGYTIGKFIGEKAARQWPDPAELNTFTYDSLFLAGQGYNHTAEDTRHLEDLIVTETAKRVAFTEANRQAFAKGLHTAYLNGAFIVPKFGVLHGQRAVAKRVAFEGSQIGYQAASKASVELTARALRFFRLHEHQRELAAPYKIGHNQDRAGKPIWKGLIGRLNEVRLESEINANISKTLLQCGQKTGALMGALMGLMVVPEAFETYSRVRGSLEAVESEYYRYKLGALRGYELGESWAVLNYTNALAKRMDSMRSRFGKHLSPISIRRPQTTSTTKKPMRGQVKGRNITRIPDDSMFATMYETDPEHTNFNNLFQYMVVNYGKNLVANHSRQSMLMLRSLVPIDEKMINDIKEQSGDLVDTTSDKKGGNHSHQDNDDVFETIKVAGELTGSLRSSRQPGAEYPVKLEIIDLGPIIDFTDAETQNDSNKKSADKLDMIPLSEALTKVNKIYIKLRLPKKDDTQKHHDDLEEYLNADQADTGDGFLCGSYSQLGTSHQFGSNDTDSQVHQQPRETQDELELEAAMLDELFYRIEKKPLEGRSAIEMTARAMKPKAAAPVSQAQPMNESPTNIRNTKQPDENSTPKPTAHDQAKPAHQSTPRPGYHSSPKPAHHSTLKPAAHDETNPARHSTALPARVSSTHKPHTSTVKPKSTTLLPKNDGKGRSSDLEPPADSGAKNALAEPESPVEPASEPSEESAMENHETTPRVDTHDETTIMPAA